MTIDDKKFKRVALQLKGLSVIYNSHRNNKSINMARVNNYSIIWHEYSYGYEDLEQVEVRLLDGDCVRYPINDLRKLVTNE